MDRRLLNFYNIELQHLRETAAEFARDFPKIAGRLSLDKEAKEICPDPFVERLLEGFAYLAARVHLKLDAEFPRFTQSILETVYPHYLSPTPSMALVRFGVLKQAAQMENGFLIPRGSSLKGSLAKDEKTACEYRTAHDVHLWPIHVVEAQYYTRDLAQLELPPELRRARGDPHPPGHGERDAVQGAQAFRTHFLPARGRRAPGEHLRADLHARHGGDGAVDERAAEEAAEHRAGVENPARRFPAGRGAASVRPPRFSGVSSLAGIFRLSRAVSLF